MISTEMVKAFQFIGAIVMFGGAFFSLFSWAPVMGRPHPALRLGVVVGAIFVLVLGGADLLRLARVAADQPLADVGLGFVADVATGTRYGRMLLVRAVLAVVALLVPRERVAAFAGFLTLVSFAYAGHGGVAVGPFLADVAHLVAMAVWAGGLAGLAALPWREVDSVSLRRITVRFSAHGVAAVAVLAVTGVYLSSQRVYGPQALVESDYGEALLAKVLLFVGLITVAAVNRFGAVPHLERRRGMLQGLVWVEVLAMLFALGFAADLTTLSPADEEPVRVALVLGDSAQVELPLGRRVLMTVTNPTEEKAGLVVRGMEHRLFRGPGALRHREMLSFAPPVDRLWVEAAPGKKAVVEFTPLAEGEFALEMGAVQGILRVGSVP